MSTAPKQKGFTIVEIILYLGVVVVAIVIASTLLNSMLQLRSKNQVIAEVEQQGQQSLYQIAQAVRNAAAITTPAVGNEDGQLEIATSNISTNPIRVSTDNNGVLTIEEAGNDSALTNDHVVISNLTFANDSRSGTPGLLTVTFTVSYNSNETRADFNYSQEFNTSISLRQ